MPAQALQGLGSDDAIVERLDPVAGGQRRLVPLAGEHDQVAGRGGRDRGMDRFFPVL